MRRWLFRVAMAGVTVAAGLAGPAWASGLQVSPIGLRLAAVTSADTLWLTNTGNDTVHAQVRVYRWTQVNGENVMTPSRDLVVSPPMLQIAPGGRQLVRVIRQVAPASDGIETAYRVIVDELPVDATGKPGLKFVLRYSIPVFLAPAGDATTKASLTARWEDTPEGAFLSVSNSGKGHAQIADVNRHGADGTIDMLLPGLVGYALPGAAMRWKLPDGARQTNGNVLARVNGETSESTLVMGANGR